MGIPSVPDPSPLGILCIILVNTAYSISIIKAIVRSILRIIGIHLSPHSESIQPSSESYNYDFCLLRSETFKQDFQTQVPPIRFDSVFSSNTTDQECLVCLTTFEHESMINHLRCGHVFHKKCLDKWLDYWNITCPLCRNPLVPEEEEEDPLSPSVDTSDAQLLGWHLHDCY